MKKAVAVGVMVLFLASCAKEGGKTGEYVAKIDGDIITAADVKKEMAGLPDMAKNFFQGPEGTSKFVDELVKRELLYLEAKKKGMDKNEEFQRKIEDFKKITLINQLLEKEIEAWSKVSDDDAKKYYDTHKDEFIVPNQIRVSQILVKTEEDAKKAFDRIRSGEDFAKVAADMSIDKSSAKSGGDLGSFKRGEMAKELEDVAFRTKKGEVSVPIVMKDGIHILKVTDVKGTTADFDKAKSAIIQRLTSKKQKEGFDSYIDGLKKNYKIEINKDALAKLAPAGAAAKPEAEEKQEAPKEPQGTHESK